MDNDDVQPNQRVRVELEGFIARDRPYAPGWVYVALPDWDRVLLPVSVLTPILEPEAGE